MKKFPLLFFLALFIFASCTPTVSNTVPPAHTGTATLTRTAIPPSSTATLTSTPTPEPLRLPDNVLPHGLGVSIHYEFVGDSYFPLAEMKLLEEAHVGFVRDDIWPGAACDGVPFWCLEYFDKLVDNMNRRGIRVVFNLVGHNFEKSGTDETRAKFVEFAGVVAEHFKGRGVIWELWAEPDGNWSWRPRSDPQEYALLAAQTIAAMKQADPDVVILGPNVATLDTVFGDNPWRFLKAVGDEGVLTQFDAINVHLHNGKAPESQIQSLLRLRRLIDSDFPDRKIPITSSEWGYTHGGEFYRLQVTPEQQAQYLVRSWLVNISHEINLSIWYDWKDEDPDAALETYDKYFGILSFSGEPKPSYHALKTLTTTLDGYQYVRRLATASDDDYLLLFRKEEAGILVAWTTTGPHPVSILNVSNVLESVDMLGTSSTLQPTEGSLELALSRSPQYILLSGGALGVEEIHWQPAGTFFRLDDTNQVSIPIKIENPSGVEQAYELQSSLDGSMIGNLQIQVDAGETLIVELPVEITDDSKDDMLVQITVSENGINQTAWVWVQK